MNEPIIKPPTKEAFYFPTSADTSGDSGEKRDSRVGASSKGARKESAKVKASAGKKKSAPAPAPVTADKGKPSKAAPAPVAAAVEAAPARQKKEKVVRDSFTMPKSDYAKIAELKQRCLAAGVQVKKGELLRAGLQLLAAASAEQLMAAVAAVEAVKTGRPVKS
ncbi:hypothetical protein P3W85_16630 [Cupriavidus basilensis]|uniref:Uncharacterized protein n=1 Tax=Cupriavidus basilensis TaxID=68895 RepID=A0ABT6APL4_9BURK|nr:hypothetical protein [Cupriavidus basilensis]MDF3834570.1 hypothetical protein [Cupriavidus basilensis]